ncbi:hypothetical protein BH23PLA1_BH23PLA1_22430 [soil metagenome]
MSDPAPLRQGPRVIDLSAIVVGYGLAALLMRAFWPATRELPGAQAVVAGGLFLWLGLAMAGPFLMLIDRTTLPEANEPADRPANSRRSWAEWAWILIGGYWIVLALLVVPSRMQVDPLLGVLPILVVVVLWLLASGRQQSRSRTTPQDQPWTHHTAIGLIVTWPLAWGALVLLGKTLF